MSTESNSHDIWPELPLSSWQDTCTTLHLWTQIVGKVRLAKTPWMNHSWHVALYVTPRGLTTSPISEGPRQFQVDFDFVHHKLVVTSSDARSGGFDLSPMTVADFYSSLRETLAGMDIEFDINEIPNEISDPLRFSEDTVHKAYDPDYANRFWRILLQSDRVFRSFRARFTGKCSPVHFFWGSFDLAVTRFSGRQAPEHPGGIPNLPDSVTREAYNREVSSAGFWPGGGGIDYPAYYSYAYPTPVGFSDAPVVPAEAFFDRNLGEFVLPYDVVRTSSDPDRTLLGFLQTTYEAAAELAQWNRMLLEREPVSPTV